MGHDNSYQKNTETTFHSSWTILLHSHKQYIKILTSTYPHQHIVDSFAWGDQLPRIICWKDYSFPVEWPCYPCWKPANIWVYLHSQFYSIVKICFHFLIKIFLISYIDIWVYLYSQLYSTIKIYFQILIKYFLKIISLSRNWTRLIKW